MTLSELSLYYSALSSQAQWMADAIESFEKGIEHTMWFSLVMWVQSKDIADEINNKYDTMAFARAMGVADGNRRAWE